MLYFFLRLSPPAIGSTQQVEAVLPSDDLAPDVEAQDLHAVEQRHRELGLRFECPIDFDSARDIDGPAMAGASVESCRCVVLRSRGGFLGSVLYTCNRLRRIRRRFNHF